MRHQPAIAGFASVDLATALGSELPVADERVEAQILYTAEANAPLVGAIWVVLDFMDFDLNMVTTIKNAICAKTAIKIDRIHILTTHNHGAGELQNLDAIAEVTANGAKDAMEAARPALVRGVQVPGPLGINYRRRIHVPQFNAAWTTFAGPNMQDKRSAAGFIKAAIHHLEEGKASYFGWEPSDEPAPQYEPGDPNFFLMQFQDAETGKTLGTLSRFAMHAIMRSNSSQYLSSDFPWHIRNLAKQRYGGHAIFMNGPCGDLAPCFPWPDKTTGIERTYAQQLLDAAMETLENTPFEPLEVRDGRRLVPLPIRQEVLDNRVDLPDTIPPMSDLPARKKILERHSFKATLPFLREKYLNGDLSVGDESIIELGIMRLGSWLIVAYPGETFWETGRAVAKAFPKLNIVSVTEHGRTLMYLPPEDEYREGGYETVCCTTKPGAEAIMRAEAIQLIRETHQRMQLPDEISTASLRQDLLDMGIAPTDTLLIHSTYKSIGNVPGGPNAVLDMLMDFFAEQGLLVFPTLSYSSKVVNPEHPFNVRTTPSCVGVLTELFRNRPGVIRSLHPTHSVAAFGKDAKSFTAGNELFNTPCAKGSPWWKLVERNAKILFIGTGLENNTFGHGIDEWLELPGMRGDVPMELQVIDYDGNLIQDNQYRHCTGRNALFALQEGLFKRTGALKQGYFGNATCFLLDCRKAVEALGVKF